MIARVWRGATRAEDADAYRDAVERTGMAAARALPGNRGTLVLHRLDGDLAEFVTVLLFGSMDDVRGFAGDEPQRARFFDEVDHVLVERDLEVRHYVVDAHLAGPD